MQRLLAGEQEVAVVNAQINGEEHLLGMAFIREIGWFNVTLMNYGQIVGQLPFASFGILLAATILLLALAILLLLNRVVLKPITRLNHSIQGFAQGVLPPRPNDHRQDELGLLEEYISQHSGAEFSHGYCPKCIDKAYRNAGLANRPGGS